MYTQHVWNDTEKKGFTSAWLDHLSAGTTRITQFSCTLILSNCLNTVDEYFRKAILLYRVSC